MPIKDPPQDGLSPAPGPHAGDSEPIGRSDAGVSVSGPRHALAQEAPPADPPPATAAPETSAPDALTPDALAPEVVASLTDALRAMYDTVVDEPLPDAFAQLLSRLDDSDG